MIVLRHLVRRYPALAALIAAAALLLRIVVPAGYMPAVDHGRVAIVICTGAGPVEMMPMPGMAHHRDDAPKAQTPCAFADLTVPGLVGATPAQLAEALLYVLILALLVAIALPPARVRHLRPPLRGPPHHG